MSGRLSVPLCYFLAPDSKPIDRVFPGEHCA